MSPLTPKLLPRQILLVGTVIARNSPSIMNFLSKKLCTAALPSNKGHLGDKQVSFAQKVLFGPVCCYSPGQWSWRQTCWIRYTRSRTRATPGGGSWWGPGGSCCWGGPGPGWPGSWGPGTGPGTAHGACPLQPAVWTAAGPPRTGRRCGSVCSQGGSSSSLAPRIWLAYQRSFSSTKEHSLLLDFAP